VRLFTAVSFLGLPQRGTVLPMGAPVRCRGRR
jgi:hypothetical protein